MARYILLPASEINTCKLLPTDTINGEVIEIDMPSELNSFEKSYQKIKNKQKLKKISMELAKSKIYRNSEGYPTDGHTTVNIDFDNAVVDLCNELYSPYYELFYVLLHKYYII